MAYTSLERSINAKKQPRDKEGKWVVTGARLVAEYERPDGSVGSMNNLRAIGGNDDGTRVRAYVTNNDNAADGIREGDVVEIDSKNAQLIVGRIDRRFLERKGIDPDLKHDLPEDLASQPQAISDLNITRASDLDKEMALGELTDEEDAEFRKEREAEPLAKLPPALAEQAKTGEEVSELIEDIESGEDKPDLGEQYGLDNAGTKKWLAQGMGGESYEVNELPDGKYLVETTFDDGNKDEKSFDSPEEAFKYVADEAGLEPTVDREEAPEAEEPETRLSQAGAIRRARRMLREARGAEGVRQTDTPESDRKTIERALGRELTDKEAQQLGVAKDQKSDIRKRPATLNSIRDGLDRAELKNNLNELKDFKGKELRQEGIDDIKRGLSEIKEGFKELFSRKKDKDAEIDAKEAEADLESEADFDKAIADLMAELEKEEADKTPEAEVDEADTEEPKEKVEKNKLLEPTDDPRPQQGATYRPPIRTFGGVWEDHDGVWQNPDGSFTFATPEDAKKYSEGEKYEGERGYGVSDENRQKLQEETDKAAAEAAGKPTGFEDLTDEELDAEKEALASDIQNMKDTPGYVPGMYTKDDAIVDLVRLTEEKRRREEGTNLPPQIIDADQSPIDNFDFDDIEEEPEPAPEAPEPARKQPDSRPPKYEDEPTKPLQEPSEDNVKEKLEAEETYEEPTEESPKTPIEEIEKLGNAEEYVDDFGGFMPSDEQANVLNAVVKGKLRTVVEALAGSGKTTTLVAAAKALFRVRPKDRVLSLQFNKKNQLEAERRMPKQNTMARTTNSLAYAALTDDQKKAMEGKRGFVVAGDRTIGKHMLYDELSIFGENFNPTRVANLVGKIVTKYSNSSDKEITRKHVLSALAGYRPEGDDSKPDPKLVAKLEDYAKKYWQDVTRTQNPSWDPKGGPKGTGGYDGKRIKITQDHAVKMWSLSEPDLSKIEVNGERVSVVFFDEAQDTNAAVAAVVKAQKNVQIVHVGDPNQAIYEWRGAINALRDAGKDADVVLPLTGVRRFGPELAGPGNAALNLLGDKARIRALGEGGGIVDRDAIPMGPDEDTAIIVRSNAGGLAEIAALLEQKKTVGVLPVFKTDLENAVYHLKWLREDFKTRGPNPKTPEGRDATSDDFSGLGTFKDLMELVKNDKESRAAKWMDLMSRMGNNDPEAGLKYIEEQIIPNIQVISDGDDTESVILDKVTGAAGEKGTALDVAGSKANFEFTKDGIEVSGDFQAFTSKVDDGLDFKGMLKENGFRWNGKDKKWNKYLPNSTDEARARAMQQVLDRVPEGLKPSTEEKPKPDVRVTTTHRMKGLEADNIIIGEDFPEPKEVLKDGKDGPKSETQMPSMEELRTIYVAVTRAREQMALGKLGWLRDFQGKEGVAKANAAMERDADVGAEAWDMPELRDVTFSPAGMLSDDDDFGDEPDDLDVDGDILPEFNQPIRTTRRTAVEDLDPDEDTYIVDPETGKNVRITDSEGEGDTVVLFGYDEEGNDYEAFFDRGNRVNQVEFGEPEPRKPEPEPEAPAPEPEAPKARPAAPGKTASQIEVGDELLDDEGNLIGKVTAVKKGKLKDGREVVAVKHDGEEGQAGFAKDEKVNIRKPVKTATPEQAKEDAEKLLDEMREDGIPETSLPTEIAETPSFLETWERTQNGTYTKYVNGERWNVKENKDGTITLRPRTNPQIGTKKYGSWEELEADFPSRIADSDEANKESLKELIRPYDDTGLMEEYIDQDKDITPLLAINDEFQDDLETGQVRRNTAAARLSRVKKDGTDVLPPERKVRTTTPRDAEIDRIIRDAEERDREAQERARERAEELEREATEREQDYEEELEDVEVPEEPTSAPEPEERPVPEGMVETPAGLIPEDLVRMDDGEDMERTPFRAEDIQEAKGTGTPEDMKAKLLEYYPDAKIAEDGSIVVHRKTYRDKIGPAAGKSVQIEIRAKETNDNKMMLIFNVDVDGKKEQYIHYSPRNSFAALTGVGGPDKQSRGIENLLNKYIERPDSDFDKLKDPEKARRLYGGAYGGIKYLRRANADNIAETGKNDTDLKLRTPEEHAKIMLSGRNQQLETDDNVFWRQRRGEVPSFFEAFEDGDQEAAVRIFRTYVNTLPDTPEAKERAYNFMKSALAEKFPNADKRQTNNFLEAAKRRIDNGFTPTDVPRATHIDRDGKQVAVGDYVEWTNNEGQVSRGRVIALKAVDNPNDGKYTFSDFAYVSFEGKDLPEALNTNNMKISDDQESKAGEFQHWIREEELAKRRAKLAGFEYDQENKVFYNPRTGKIVDFEGRTPEELADIESRLGRAEREDPEIAEELGDPGEQALELPVDYDPESPLGEVGKRELQKAADTLAEVDTDNEHADLIERARKAETKGEAISFLAELQNVAEKLASKEGDKKSRDLAPEKTGNDSSGAAERLTPIISIEQHNPLDISAARANRDFSDESPIARVEGDSSKVVVKPTADASQKVTDMKAAGEDLHNRAVDRMETPEYKARGEKIQKETDALRAKQVRAEQARDEFNEKRKKLMEDPTSTYSERRAANKEYERLNSAARRAADARTVKEREYKNLYRSALVEEMKADGVEFNNVDFDDRLKQLKRGIRNYMDFDLPSSSSFYKSIYEAMELMPRPLLERMKKHLEDNNSVIRVKSGKRRGHFGSYNDGNWSLQLVNDEKTLFPERGNKGGVHGNNALHELWHFAQNIVPEIGAAEKAFLYQRSVKKDENGNDVVSYKEIPGYPGEFGLDAGFNNPYTGKTYDRSVPGTVLAPGDRTDEIGTTLLESVFGTDNSSFVKGQGRSVLGRDKNGKVRVWSETGEQSPDIPIRSSKGYFNEDDGKWYEDSAFSNPIEVVRQTGRPVGETDQDAVNFILGLMLGFGKAPE